MKFFRFLIVNILVVSTFTFAVFAANTGTITGSVVNVRSGASTEHEILFKLKRDTKVDIVSIESDWYYIYYQGKYGFVVSDYLAMDNYETVSADPIAVEIPEEHEEAPAEIYGIITGSVVNFRHRPSTDSDILAKLREGTYVIIKEQGDEWFTVIYGDMAGYVHADYIEQIDGVPPVQPVGTMGEQIVEYARNFLGVRYVSGGQSPKGFDCSGFVYYVFGHFGYNLPRTATTQYNATTKISRSELRIGDLVYFSKPGSSKIAHVGIYIADGTFIHSSSPGDVVKYDTIYKGYYNTYYYGASRVNF